MNITHLRRESTNTMIVDIDGQQYRIYGANEITAHEKTTSIPGCFQNAASLDEARHRLSLLGRTLHACAAATVEIIHGLPKSLYVIVPESHGDLRATVNITPIGQQILAKFGRHSDEWQEFYDGLRTREVADFEAGKPVVTARWFLHDSAVVTKPEDPVWFDLHKRLGLLEAEPAS